MKVQARKVYTITWTGTNKDYIRVANEISLRRTNQGIDSLDLGDATGAILAWAESPSSPDMSTEHDMCFYNYGAEALSVSWEWELFEYPEPNEGQPTHIGEDEL